MIGDKTDQFSRLKALIPRGWFGDTTTIIDALLKGIAKSKACVYSLIAFVALQSRIKTATGGFLDMIAADFFGGVVVRAPSQTDDSFRATITANLFRERGTRNALTSLLTQLTGRAPTIFEAQRPSDTGAYGMPNSGYGVAGGYASTSVAYQAFVTVYRPTNGTVISDADLYAAVNSIKPVGTIIWVRISN